MRKDDPRRFRHLLPMEERKRRLSAATWFKISAGFAFATILLLIASAVL